MLALFVPLALVFIVDGRRALRQVWLPALVCGFAFAVAQWLTSTYFSVPLADIVAALVGALAVVALLRFWQPAEGYQEVGDQPVGMEPVDLDAVSGGAAGSAATPSGGATGTRTGVRTEPAVTDSGGEIAKAYAPYLVIIAVFSLVQIPALKSALAESPFFYSFQWPGLHLLTAGGDPSTLPTFNLNWLGAAGTLMIISGLITMPIIGISPLAAARAYLKTYVQLAAAIVTVMAVLGLAYVMNSSGQTTSLGTWMAQTGSAFALLSPVLGWLGVAVTGSDTSSNSLFGALQVTAAGRTGLDPALMAAANSSGGVLGKMISPQNLAIAAAAVGMTGREGDIFRKVVGWSVLFLAVMCVLVYLQTTVLAWMLP